MHWVDWDTLKTKAISAGSALDAVNDRDPHIRIDPTVLGARLALGANSLQEAYPEADGEYSRHIDQAALVFSGIKPDDLSHDPHSTQRLAALRASFLEALAKDWLKTKIFEHVPNLVEQHPTPRSNGFTIINANGKSFEELANDPSLARVPGLSKLSDGERTKLVAEWFEDHGLDRNHRVGTIEFSLASTIRTLSKLSGRDVPDNLEDRSVLVKAFHALVTDWREHPEAHPNPVVLASIHLARSSGEKFAGKDWQANLEGALAYFSERWLANFGTPPAAFDRARAALEILENETGWDRDELADEPQNFVISHPYNVVESVFESPWQRFLSNADLPGPFGHFLSLRCKHDERHGTHVLNPRQALQKAEQDYNTTLLNHPWVLARAKENLRLKGESLSAENMHTEISRITENYAAETENHRHLISGLYFLKDWYISQIPIVGGLYNLEEGIRHHNVKQMIGGGLALGFDVGGVALGMRRGGGLAALERIEVTPEMNATEALHHLAAEIDLPVARSSRSELGAASFRFGSEVDDFSITPVGEEEYFTDAPARFQKIEPGVKYRYEHPVTGEMLTVTRIESTGEILALRSVPGQQRTFQAVDWISGEGGGIADAELYHMDPETGLIEKGGGLRGGMRCCSKPPKRPGSPEIEDLPYQPAQRTGIREPFNNPALEPRDDAPRVTGRKGDARDRSDSAVTAREASESFSSDTPSLRQGDDNASQAPIGDRGERGRSESLNAERQPSASVSSGVPSIDSGDLKSVDLSSTRRPSQDSGDSLARTPVPPRSNLQDDTSSVHSVSSTSTVIERPDPTDVSRSVIKDGGSSVDAAIAHQLASGSTDMESSVAGGSGFSQYFRQPPLKSFPKRIGELADRSSLLVLPEDRETGLPGQVYLNDWAGFDPYANGMAGPVNETMLSEPLQISGPTAEMLTRNGRYMGDDALGRLYLYEGRYWSVIIPDGVAPPGLRARAAAEAWNSAHQEYAFGRAVAHDLGNGKYAVSTPRIPVNEGFGRAHNLPEGHYGLPPKGLTPLSREEMPPPPKPQPGEVGDRLVINTGGHRIEGRENVYWYENAYWTFQSGPTLQERYWNAVQFAEDWNKAYGEVTQTRAVVKILPGDRSVAVLTPPLPEDFVLVPQMQMFADEISLSDLDVNQPEHSPEETHIQPDEQKPSAQAVSGDEQTGQLGRRGKLSAGEATNETADTGSKVDSDSEMPPEPEADHAGIEVRTASAEKMLPTNIASQEAASGFEVTPPSADPPLPAPAPEPKSGASHFAHHPMRAFIEQLKQASIANGSYRRIEIKKKLPSIAEEPETPPPSPHEEEIDSLWVT
ncbi:hypothetical protein [Rhodoligotrophos ferricapiens]|uniref:hypothetical protein n=1 Tax=Rhodoligotrophos ferricapiens TaxID=3069264 RepID=UPI00315D2236